MKKVILLSVFLVSSVFASQSYRFTYFGNEGNVQVFLSCDYAQYSAERIMEKMGFRNIKTQCSGGITPIGAYFPISLNINFDFPSDDVDVRVENDRFNNSNCFFDTRFIRGLTQEFSNEIVVTKKRSHCFASDSRYFFDLEIL